MQTLDHGDSFHIYQAITYNQDYSNKIYCKKHCGEYITSICLEKNCDEGLCPECYSEHFHKHQKETESQKLPNIQYFDKAIDQTNIILESAISQLSNMEKQLNMYYRKVDFKTIMSEKERLMKVKEVIFTIIESYFENLSKSMDHDLIKLEHTGNWESLRRSQGDIDDQIKELTKWRKNTETNKSLDVIKAVKQINFNEQIREFAKTTQNLIYEMPKFLSLKIDHQKVMGLDALQRSLAYSDNQDLDTSSDYVKEFEEDVAYKWNLLQLNAYGNIEKNCDKLKDDFLTKIKGDYVQKDTKKSDFCPYYNVKQHDDDDSVRYTIDRNSNVNIKDTLFNSEKIGKFEDIQAKMQKDMNLSQIVKENNKKAQLNFMPIRLVNTTRSNFDYYDPAEIFIKENCGILQNKKLLHFEIAYNKKKSLYVQRNCEQTTRKFSNIEPSSCLSKRHTTANKMKDYENTIHKNMVSMTDQELLLIGGTFLQEKSQVSYGTFSFPEDFKVKNFFLAIKNTEKALIQVPSIYYKDTPVIDRVQSALMVDRLSLYVLGGLDSTNRISKRFDRFNIAEYRWEAMPNFSFGTQENCQINMSELNYLKVGILSNIEYTCVEKDFYQKLEKNSLFGTQNFEYYVHNTFEWKPQSIKLGEDFDTISDVCPVTAVSIDKNSFYQQIIYREHRINMYKTQLQHCEINWKLQEVSLGTKLTRNSGSISLNGFYTNIMPPLLDQEKIYIILEQSEEPYQKNLIQKKLDIDKSNLSNSIIIENSHYDNINQGGLKDNQCINLKMQVIDDHETRIVSFVLNKNSNLI